MESHHRELRIRVLTLFRGSGAGSVGSAAMRAARRESVSNSRQGVARVLTTVVLLLSAVYGNEQALEIVAPLEDSEHALGNTPVLEAIVRLGSAGWDVEEHTGAEILAHVNGAPFASHVVSSADCLHKECRVRFHAPEDLREGEHVFTTLLIFATNGGHQDVAAESSVAILLVGAGSDSSSKGKLEQSAPASSNAVAASPSEQKIAFTSPPKNNTSFLDPRKVVLAFHTSDVWPDSQQIMARVIVSGRVVSILPPAKREGGTIFWDVPIALETGVHTATVQPVDRFAGPPSCPQS